MHKIFQEMCKHSTCMNSNHKPEMKNISVHEKVKTHYNGQKHVVTNATFHFKIMQFSIVTRSIFKRFS